MTGFSPDTLRYYEKLGLLDPTQRGPGGVRAYSDDNVHVLAALKCLKQTGLSLEHIKEFIQVGQVPGTCLSTLSGNEIPILSRVKILSEHLNRLEEQRRELEKIIQETKQKLHHYNELLGKKVEV